MNPQLFPGLGRSVSLCAARGRRGVWTSQLRRAAL